ncbi:sterol desaturase family protein [Noviherbaspirillum galbum]|uniref:Sterol desaturase family protein n=1 Tax=Noviherbaspirillum galbum TaxID=2709383 RepID=A0A6B3SLQ6_9BURK|nr:sterol desaturase family protein [Noviherbaspirillum galbum]NEX61677.1 sterol desaturase family protein [Noviherbaspirillum galbum]
MHPIDKFLLMYAAPAVLACALIEAFVLSRKRSYDWGAFGVSTLDMVLRIAANIFIPFSIATFAVRWAYLHRLSPVALDGPLAILALFIGQEFCYYWFHRAAHRVRWFWCNHAVHHSPNELNLSTAIRIGFAGKLSGVSLFFAPLIWLGFDPRIVFATLSLNLLYQFWIHATWIPKLGWLEGILNTPSAHRVHHASNLDYLDANYGGVLLIFDRMFGTYVPEQDRQPCIYGLVHPLRTNNLLKVEFFEWMALARDLRGARSLRAVLGHLFMPPGWSPDGAGTTTAELRARRDAQPRTKARTENQAEHA